MLSKETGHQVCYMPEFLTERTHIEDFKKQTMVFTGAVDLLIKVFPGKKFTVMSPLEAELTKYIHNVFGAYKVTYFNAAKEYVEKMGGDWAKVHTGVLLSGYINDTHTYVPGPDGKFGYGGKCFPKDVNAFAKMTQGTSMGTLPLCMSLMFISGVLRNISNANILQPANISKHHCHLRSVAVCACVRAAH